MTITTQKGTLYLKVQRTFLCVEVMFLQFPKEDIRANILVAAREEFLQNGYEKASIRNIAAAAKTSKSNVYNYFPDKDALFAAVVEPTILGIKSGLAKIRARNRNTSAEAYTVAAQKKIMTEIISFVYSHQEDFKLLLFRSSGSSLSEFKASVTEAMADVLSDWISFAAPEKGIPRFFIRTVAGFYVGAIEQMLAQGVTLGQAAGHFEVFLRFVYGGWHALLTTGPIDNL